MSKFGAGIFAGALIGMGVGMLDKRTMRKAKKIAKSMTQNMSCGW